MTRTSSRAAVAAPAEDSQAAGAAAAKDVVRGGLIPGALAGAAGGLVFGAAMIELGILDTIASLVRADSSVLGFVVHMAVAVVIGAGFGVLVWFQRPEVGETVFWGLAYGAVWWFVGAVTLLPLLSGEPIAWNVDAARELVPALLGHLVYGGVAGLALVVFKSAHYRAAEAFDVGHGTVVRGLIAGLLSSLLLGSVLEDQLGVPAVSAAMTDKTRLAAWVVTLAIGAIAGVGYALLYPRASDGAGPAPHSRVGLRVPLVGRGCGDAVAAGQRRWSALVGRRCASRL